MSEHKPFFKKVEEEVDAFLALWNHRRGLALIGILVLLIMGGYFVRDWYKRGADIQSLQVERKGLLDELNTIRTENKSLRETVAPLLKQAAEEFPGEEISISLKKLISLLQDRDPYEQPIRTATATVEVIIESNEQLATTYMDQGGYLAFGKGREALIAMAGTQCRAKQIGNGQIIYRGVFAMDATHPAAGKSLSFLREAEYVQISFRPMPRKSKVIGGKAICTFNSQERIEIEVPPQQMEDEKILVRNLGKIF